MAETLRKYSKANPENELLPPQIMKPVEEEVHAISPIQTQTEDYQKQDLEIMPKAFFVIISGGEEREKGYFRIISKHDKFERIKL